MVPLLLALAALAPQPPRLVLSSDMLVNETAYGDEALLVDEQAADEANPPKRPFFGGWTAWQYPMHVAIDLGSRCRIDQIDIYNETGGGQIAISTGKPGAWQAQALELGGYLSWNRYPIQAETRWLRLTVNGPSNVSELIVSGTRLEAVPPPAKPPARKPGTPMDAFIGTNAFIDDPIERIATPAGFVREYHPWGWDVEGKDGQVSFQPSAAAGGNAWFFDDYYAKLKSAGATVCPVVWQAPSPLFTPKSPESKPIAEGADPEDPASYRAHAEHLFQFAARYGSRKVADGLLKLAPGQPRRSGLGSLSFVENWNEPDKTWEGREGRFNPYDLAALSSADYDGHQGKLGPAAGVKRADPKFRLVLGGLAGLNLDMLKAIKLWADVHRGGSFPADVVNLHHYSSTGNEQSWSPNGHGISPEQDRLRERVAEIVDWVRLNVPGREVWMTEFGYDTHPASPIHAPTIGKMNPEQVQAAWLVRAYFALAAAGVDRAAMFMLRDVKSGGGGVFETCGLVREKGDWTPKPSYHHVAALRRHLAGYRFSRVLADGTARVWSYEFSGPGGKRAVAVWCPSSEDRRVPGYELPASGRRARLAEFSDSDPAGRTSDLPIRAGKVTLEASETPKIVLLDR